MKQSNRQLRTVQADRLTDRHTHREKDHLWQATGWSPTGQIWTVLVRCCWSSHLRCLAPLRHNHVIGPGRDVRKSRDELSWLKHKQPRCKLRFYASQTMIGDFGWGDSIHQSAWCFKISFYLSTLWYGQQRCYWCSPHHDDHEGRWKWFLSPSSVKIYFC